MGIDLSSEYARKSIKNLFQSKPYTFPWGESSGGKDRERVDQSQAATSLHQLSQKKLGHLPGEISLTHPCPADGQLSACHTLANTTVVQWASQRTGERSLPGAVCKIRRTSSFKAQRTIAL